MRISSHPVVGRLSQPKLLRGLFSFVFLLAPVHIALATSVQQDREKWFSICSDISTTGRMIMEGRQNGVSQDVMVNAADGNRLTLSLIEEAYQTELFPTDQAQQDTASEFEQDLYKRCSDGAPFK